MGADSPNRLSTQAGAVFLSYASEDAEPAQRICEALRAAGIKVWFDQSELQGRDAWDRRIREGVLRKAQLRISGMRWRRMADDERAK